MAGLAHHAADPILTASHASVVSHTVVAVSKILAQSATELCCLLLCENAIQAA